MEKLLILEVRDGANHLKEWHKIRSYPMSIGRAYSNDIVIDDPFMCPEHLRLENGNGDCVLVKNLSRVNGTVLERDAKKIEEVAFSHGLVLRAGKTRLVFNDGSQSVAPALTEASNQSTFSLDHVGFVRMLIVFILSVVFAFIKQSWFKYHGDTPQIELKLALMALGGHLLLFLPWAALWSFAGLIFLRRANYSAHLVIALLVAWCASIFSMVFDYLEFSFNSKALGLGGFAVGAVCCFSLLVLHMNRATRNSPRRNQVIAGTLMAVFCALGGAFAYISSNEFSSRISPDMTLKAPAFRLVSGSSIESFMADVSNLEADLQAEVESTH